MDQDLPSQKEIRGQQTLEWRKWHGNEIVMDAGCGSGLFTKQLAQKVPRGKVYAVDIDPNMVNRQETIFNYLITLK
jgi:ubiquinone/menaquinone biosynthesis C-methylase UbiE